MREHHYETHIAWTGNEGQGTKSYKAYTRDHTITVAGKPALFASSDPAFRGDPSRYNPEELLVASLSSCHMLWYLHLCAVNQIVVTEYQDDAQGVMRESADGSGEFVEVTLRPQVTVAANADQDKALALHEDAHRYCFIANSVKFPVKTAPAITSETAVAISAETRS
jgi:organic hydroperoxide reductase OsmC/OhrA